MNWFIFIRSHNIDLCLQDGLPKKNVKILLETVKRHGYYLDDKIQVLTLTRNRTSVIRISRWFLVNCYWPGVQTASVTLWRSWVAKEYSSGLSSNYQVAAKKNLKIISVLMADQWNRWCRASRQMRRSEGLIPAGTATFPREAQHCRVFSSLDPNVFAHVKFKVFTSL